MLCCQGSKLGEHLGWKVREFIRQEKLEKKIKKRKLKEMWKQRLDNMWL